LLEQAVPIANAPGREDSSNQSSRTWVRLEDRRARPSPPQSSDANAAVRRAAAGVSIVSAMAGRGLRCARRAAVGVTGALLAGLAFTSHARADDAPLFALGAQQAGLSLVYGQGIDFAGSGRVEGDQMRVLGLLPHWQIDVTRRPERPAWYGGSVAFRVEGVLSMNFAPRLGVAAGGNLLLRYQLLHWDSVTPYVEAGAGALALQYHMADQDDGFTFTPQGGIGLCTRVGRRTSLDAGVRFHHASNAYTHLPNGGLDSVQFRIGLAYHFE
jgi:opacity protein-like surface antigen